MIILTRFYKLPYNIIINAVEKYKTIEEIIKNVLIPNNKDNLPNYGLTTINKGFYIEKNAYQSLYNYTLHKANNETDNINSFINRPFDIFYDDLMNAEESYKQLIKNNNIEQYMKLFISLNHIYFYDFNMYTPFNILYYGDMVAPSIDMFLQFISLNDMTKFQNECYKNLTDIKNNINLKNYFNPISHHLFITPYLIESEYIKEFIDIKYINSMMNVISNKIKGIWFEKGKPFNLKNIDPIQFINICNNMIEFYQADFINKILINNNNLLL